MADGSLKCPICLCLTAGPSGHIRFERRQGRTRLRAFMRCDDCGSTWWTKRRHTVERAASKAALLRLPIQDDIRGVYGNGRPKPQGCIP